MRSGCSLEEGSSIAMHPHPLGLPDTALSTQLTVPFSILSFDSTVRNMRNLAHSPSNTLLASTILGALYSNLASAIPYDWTSWKLLRYEPRNFLLFTAAQPPLIAQPLFFLMCPATPVPSLSWFPKFCMQPRTRYQLFQQSDQYYKICLGIPTLYPVPTPIFQLNYVTAHSENVQLFLISH